MTLQQLAQWYLDRVAHKTRVDGTKYVSFNADGVETERCRALAMAAHHGMLPDDWQYEFIERALSALAEADDPDEIVMEQDVYNSKLTAWLASHRDRPGYVEEAAKEYGLDASDLFALLSAGQRAEMDEVLGAVRAHLESEVSDDDTEA